VKKIFFYKNGSTVVEVIIKIKLKVAHFFETRGIETLQYL